VSLNRWVFKWRLKVRMFSHSRMSAGREFQVDGAATEKARRASSVYARNDEHRSIRSVCALWVNYFLALSRSSASTVFGGLCFFRCWYYYGITVTACVMKLSA